MVVVEDMVVVQMGEAAKVMRGLGRRRIDICIQVKLPLCTRLME